MKLRDHSFIGATQSLCPECLVVLPAKIIVKNNRVYFRKHCPTHGVREDFVCSDAAWFDRNQYATPGKIPDHFGTTVNRGCPYDCGLCDEHEQHTCIALLEITSNCNLKCPMCFAGSGPGGTDLSLDDALRCIDRLVYLEGRPEVLQLSGGEPTIHPHFAEILDHACRSPIDVVMINTNGIKIANDDKLLEQIASHRGRAEVYLQFDGLSEKNYQELRGANLLETKLRAVERLGDVGIPTTLVSTLTAGVNENQIGDVIRFALSHSHVTGVSFQPATYSGRYFLPSELENRITFPDVVEQIAIQAGETFSRDDFLPLPCAHPNAHTLTYAVRDGDRAIPLGRLIDLPSNMDLLANGIVFTRQRAKELIQTYLQRTLTNCDAGCESSTSELAKSFFHSAENLTLQQSDLLRITITSFMDAYNFDIRQLMKSCVHHVLPSGHLVPFSAYNVLYRDGHLPLPVLSDQRHSSAASAHHSLPIIAS